MTASGYMALRMMVYVGLLYQDLLKRREVSKTGLLPPVLPIVLYNGERRWSAKRDIAELIPQVPGLLEAYKPRMQYLLIDQGSFLDSELASQRNLVAALFRLEQAPIAETLQQVIANLADWLSDRSDLQRLMVNWLLAVLAPKPGFENLSAQVDDLKELRIMLSERMDQWEKGYFESGRLKGEQQTLLRLASRKFGTLPLDIQRLIQQASVEQIDSWVDQILDAKSLEALFGNDALSH